MADDADDLESTLVEFRKDTFLAFFVGLVERFPTTASANGVKIQRAKLREMALERLADERTGSDDHGDR